MYNNNNNGLQGYGPPLQGYSDPLSNNYSNPNTMNSTMPIPGTYMPPNGQIPLNLMGSAVITGGNDGPLYINPRNPSLATNSRNLTGKICTSCGKGILLLDMDMVRNGNGQCLLCLAMLCPCICCWLMCKKVQCTSCKAEFPNSC